MPIKDIVLPIAIGIIMFGIGLNLKFKNFKEVFVQPKAILTGLFGQMIILPAMGFLIAFLSPIEPIYKVGIVLISACPGGSTSNLVTHYLKGRVALSVSLTSFNSLLILFTVPLIVSAGARLFGKGTTDIELSFWNTFTEILTTVIIPVAIGVSFNEKLESLADWMRKPMKFIMPGVLVAMTLFVIFGDGGKTTNGVLDHIYLIIPLLILNLTTMWIGYLGSRTIGIEQDGQYTIAIEMGLQNSALAIFVASSVMEKSEVAVVALIYGGFSLISTTIVAYGMKKQWFKQLYYKLKNDPIH